LLNNTCKKGNSEKTNYQDKKMATKRERSERKKRRLKNLNRKRKNVSICKEEVYDLMI